MCKSAQFDTRWYSTPSAHAFVRSRAPPESKALRTNSAGRHANSARAKSTPPGPSIEAPLDMPAAYDSSQALRRYLTAVYPAAEASIAALELPALRTLFESLDYYYACDTGRSAAMQPGGGCTRISTLAGGQSQAPALPYLPNGTYYRAQRPQDPGAQRWNTNGALLEHAQPVQRLTMPLHGSAIGTFHSALAGRAGPQPAWTNPFAITRYVWYPNGMDQPSSAFRPREATLAEFDLTWNDPRVQGVQRLGHGDWVEVENYGGPIWAPCPPSCGFWANIWRGTGVFMRLSRPLVSLSKTTAIVEMLRQVGAAAGGEEYLTLLSVSIGVAAEVRLLRAKFPRAPLADTVAAVLMTSRAPCTVLPDWSVIAPLFNAEWGGNGNGTNPSQVARRLLLAAGSRRLNYALYWAYGVCGRGPYYSRKKAGLWSAWDSLLARLACALGVQTVVLAASPNGNGLLHQELVDFDLPPELGGWPAPPKGTLNPSRSCYAPLPGAPKPASLAAYWKASSKFGLRDPVSAIQAQPRAERCRLFDGKKVWTQRNRCRGVGDGKSRDARPCWLWCSGSMSEAHREISMTQVFAG